MTILLPAADAVADTVASRIPQAAILRYEDAPRDRLGDVTFYCLPYMGGADSAAVMASMPRLEVVQSLSSGVDDVLDAVPPQAVLCNGRGLRHEEGTAELAAILTLASLRQLPEFVRQQGQRSWRHVRTDSLEGKRVLIVGYGAIGAAVEERLKPFGARFSRVSRTARDGVAPLPRLAGLAAAADVMVVCIALSPQTRGLIDAAVLAALPAGALVVNVARGPVIDAPALTAELQAGRLRAALDVTDPEPLAPGRPEWNLPNVLITPHIGGDTTAFAERCGGFVADQVARYLAGQPLRNIVRPAISQRPNADSSPV
jgi:phosphoglycerate dehydrogenase-like enzyme